MTVSLQIEIDVGDLETGSVFQLKSEMMNLREVGFPRVVE